MLPKQTSRNARGAKTILICGAGIAGPTLAYWLAEHGFEPTLLERAPRVRTGGYMLDFWGLGFDVAERMRLLPVLRERGYAIDSVRFVDAAFCVALSNTQLRQAVFELLWKRFSNSCKNCG